MKGLGWAGLGCLGWAKITVLMKKKIGSPRAVLGLLGLGGPVYTLKNPNYPIWASSDAENQK